MLRHPQQTPFANVSGKAFELPAPHASPITSKSHPPLAACVYTPRILIIEDELLVAVIIEEMIRHIGYRVSGVAHTMAMAGQEFAKRNYDGVLLDFNIGGRYHVETADHLLGWSVPFAFVTGYDYLVEPRHEKVPLLQKPFTALQLRLLLENLVGPPSAGRAQTA